MGDNGTESTSIMAKCSCYQTFQIVKFGCYSLYGYVTKTIGMRLEMLLLRISTIGITHLLLDLWNSVIIPDKLTRGIGRRFLLTKLRCFHSAPKSLVLSDRVLLYTLEL